MHRTTSYKLFIIMDTLRKRAGFSVTDLRTILDVSESSYSRILKTLTEKPGVGLSSPMDVKVQKAVQILSHGYRTMVLSSTQGKFEADVAEAVLNQLRFEVNELECMIGPDSSTETLLQAADGLLI